MITAHLRGVAARKSDVRLHRQAQLAAGRQCPPQRRRSCRCVAVPPAKLFEVQKLQPRQPGSGGQARVRQIGVECERQRR